MAELNDDDLQTIRETYALINRVDERLKNHLEWSEKLSHARSEQIKNIEDRLNPVEDLYNDIKKFLKVSTFIGVPTLATLGAIFWEGLKATLKRVLGHTQP